MLCRELEAPAGVELLDYECMDVRSAGRQLEPPDLPASRLDTSRELHPLQLKQRLSVAGYGRSHGRGQRGGLYYDRNGLTGSYLK